MYSSIFCSQSLLLKYHNCKPQGISNQYYPVLDNVQDFTFEIFSEFLWATMVILYSFWATIILLFKGWSIKISKINTFLQLILLKNLTKIITITEWPIKVFQKMNNLSATYSPGQPVRYLYLLWATRALPFRGWATTMFIILCEQSPIFSLKFFSKLEMCQRGPGYAGRIPRLVLSYLTRYYLT